MEHSNSNQTLFLPVVVVSRVDVGRLLREITSLDAFLMQKNLQKPHEPTDLPRLTALLEDTVNLNKIDLKNKPERKRLISFLESVKTEAPILHMSFSAPATPRFIHRLVAYVRQEIHPLALLSIGLQPNIGAGCMVRTTNKFFDFSLRQHFLRQRKLFISTLHATAEKVQKEGVTDAEGTHE